MNDESLGAIRDVLTSRGQLLSSDTILSILDKELSPLLKKDLGLNVCKNYSWAEDNNTEIRRVFNINYDSKNHKGTFSWGLHLTFIPTYSQNYDNKIEFHSKKSFKDSYQTIFSFDQIIEKENYFGDQQKFEQSKNYFLYFDTNNFPKLLKEVYENAKRQAINFYDDTKSLESLRNYIETNLITGVGSFNLKRLYVNGTALPPVIENPPGPSIYLNQKDYLLMVINAQLNDQSNTKKYFKQWVNSSLKQYEHSLVQAQTDTHQFPILGASQNTKKLLNEMNSQQIIGNILINPTALMLSKNFGINIDI